MERATKLLVLAWVCSGVAVDVWLLSGGWPRLPLLAAILFGVSTCFAALGWRAAGVVLLFTYTYPVVIKVFHGSYHIYFGVLWTTALLGTIAPDALRTPWHLPVRWRLPLAGWCLVVAVGATIVILREMDFYPGLVVRERAAGPIFAAQWIFHLAVASVLGILWFDWLHGRKEIDFETSIALPLASSVAVLCAIAIYQAVVDVHFLNDTPYAALGRAAGTMFDANLSATAAAFWVAGAIAVGASSRRLVPAAILLFAIAWLAVLATGSRTGFGAASITTVCAVVVAVRRGDLRGRGALRSIAVASLVVIAGLWIARDHLTVVGPVQRLVGMLPGWSFVSLRAFVAELWNRNLYGTIATDLIRQFPWFGIGLGTFHTLATEIAQSRFALVLVPDNAQNWYRQLFVEFGLIGSIPWMAWVARFAWVVLRGETDDSLGHWALRAALIGFGFVSFFGVPAQEVAIAITFWTFAFWARPRQKAANAPTWTASLTWGALVGLVCLFAVGTAYVSATRLRPPVRAQWLGLPYGYGWNMVEAAPSGGEQHWARRRATAVVPARDRWLRLRVGVNHLDVASRPVHAKVWVDGALVIDTKLTTPDPVFRYVELPPGQRATLIETWVDRVVRPREFHVPDDRELGLLVQWDFVHSAPH